MMSLEIYSKQIPDEFKRKSLHMEIWHNIVYNGDKPGNNPNINEEGFDSLKFPMVNE